MILESQREKNRCRILLEKKNPLLAKTGRIAGQPPPPGHVNKLQIQGRGAWHAVPIKPKRASKQAAIAIQCAR
jgi:hypothetical protein